MKKRVSFALVLLLAATLGAWAHPVDLQRAQRVGSTYLSAMGHGQAGKLTAVAVPYVGFYVFNADGGGFVLVAADDCVHPILGYSTSGTFRVEGMPENVSSWLAGYEWEIAAAKAAQPRGDVQVFSAEGDRIAAEWRRLESGLEPQPLLTTAVSPLITTTWNQSPYYNEQCPYDEDYDEHVVTGCVATATAQIMKFWNHPAQGYGSHSYNSWNSHTSYGTLTADFGNTTYNWSVMPNALTAVSSQAEINEVAKLMSHVGIAIEMEYDVSANGGSSAPNYAYDGTPRASSQFALHQYFKYSPDMTVVHRDEYDNATYCALLRAELDQQRPILHDGANTSGGHSFVCDGYDAQGYFHFNWGWGGYCDGYFVMGSLNPGTGGTGGNSSGTYNVRNAAILGIRPNTSFGQGGTVSVSTTGGGIGCSATGGGTYSFGDTVVLRATAGEGYRFAGWNDHSRFNPRAMIMTGGNYSYTARFEGLGSDTVSYCGTSARVSSFGNSSYGLDKYWGIKLPASALTVGRSLTAMDFYVVDAGVYDVTIYSGTTAPTDTVYSTTVTVNYGDIYSWIAVYLPQPYTVESGKSLWLTLHNTDIYYPACLTKSTGNADAMLWGENFDQITDWSDRYSFMIRGLFTVPGIIASGDTLSYCGNKSHYGSSSSSEWGIMIPAADLAGRNYLQGVNFLAPHSGIYYLNIYKGGSDAPGTLVHTQPVGTDDYGWHYAALDTLMAIGSSDSLWITLTNPTASGAAAFAHFTGNSNSNWVKGTGNSWTHFDGVSWLIKAVTSATAPAVAAPMVAIAGEHYVGLGSTATFTAVHSNGTTVSWTFSGGTPSSATGDTVTTTWNSLGYQSVQATVSNSYGTDSAFFGVSVVECGQPISDYPYINSFETTNNLVCFGTADADSDGQGWAPYSGYAYQGDRSYYSAAANGADNWLFLPPMLTRAGGGYTLQWEARSSGTSSAHYGVYIDTTVSTTTSNYVLLAEYDQPNPWFDYQSLDLTAYAGKTFRLAFRHFNSGNAGLMIDYLEMSEYIPFFQEGDTISFCGYHTWQGRNLGYNGGDTYWGVRFSPAQISMCDTLKSVLLYVAHAGDYTLRVAQGGDEGPNSPILTMTRTFTDNDLYEWQTFTLAQPVAIDRTLPLWLTFGSNADYPATYTPNTGDPNGDWLSGNDASWTHAWDYDFSASWMIKAVVGIDTTCGFIQLPYTSNFEHCWTATGGATIESSTRASFTQLGETLISPWMEAPAGNIYFSHTLRRSNNDDYWNNWEDSVVYYYIDVEDENGNLAYRFWGDSYSNHDSYTNYFQSDGGRIRFRFYLRNDTPRLPNMMYLENLEVYAYNMSVNVIFPTDIHIGDTVTFTNRVTMEGNDVPDDRSLSFFNQDWTWIDPWDSSYCTLVSQTDSSYTLVWHQAGQYKVEGYASMYSPRHVYMYSGYLPFYVLDTMAVDCDALTLPYTANFYQCWTADVGASFPDPGHAQLGARNRKVVGPWINVQDGLTFLQWEAHRDGECSWSNAERYRVIVEHDDGGVTSELLNEIEYIYNSLQRYDFYSPAGRVRIVMEQIGNASIPSFQISDVMMYQYDIDVYLEMPRMAAVGDTITITAHTTLQNGDTADMINMWMWDMPEYVNYCNLIDYFDCPAGYVSLVSQTDNSVTVRFNTAGSYEVGSHASKWNVYNGNSADIYYYKELKIVEQMYIEDSIYYTSAAKDTVIGCHEELYRALLPESVRVIVDSAFFDLPNLSVIDLPDGLTHIGMMAFAWNNGLREVTIPRGVQFMGDNAFWSCNGLEVVYFNADSCTVMGTTDGDYIKPVFIHCDNMHTVIFGENVKNVPPRAFAHCYGLRGDIVFPDSVINVGRLAFYRDRQQTDDTIRVVLGRSMREVGDMAFQFYNEFRSVVSRNPEPPIIHNYTFGFQPDITTLTVPCGSAEAYHNAYYWYEFTNVIEDCNNGIDDVEGAELPVIYSVEGAIVVDGAQGEPVEVYDMMGRTVTTTVANGLAIKVPTTGVYMVRVGQYSAQKVVVIK